jgi:hypothetical protein
MLLDNKTQNSKRQWLLLVSPQRPGWSRINVRHMARIALRVKKNWRDNRHFALGINWP